MADSKVFNLEQGVTAIMVAQGLEAFFQDKKGLLSEIVETPQGIVVQARQKDSWKKFVGMDNAVQVQIFDQQPSIIVNVGSGKWIDKAGAATVGAIVFAPLLVTAAIGAWASKKLPDEIYDFIERFILSGGKTASVSMRMSDGLKAGEALCPSCKAKNAESTKFCNSCGANMTNPCPKCGANLKPGIKFCSECGANTEVEAKKAQEDSIVNCEKCENVIPDGVKFCPNCGTAAPVKLEPGAAVCSQCRIIVAENVKFCPECGGAVIQKQKPKCTKCATEVEDGVKFCPECGGSVE